MWYVPFMGSSTVIAILATFHVFASHTSVGASILLAYLATVAYRTGEKRIYDFIKRYILVLLLFSYVSGSITGPGIWFSTTVANPRGISALIHNFVWVWAAEWIWFVAEVTLVYILFYTLGRVAERTWLKLAWTFAISSWATMLMIVGILSFMLSPGSERWFTSGNILDAFYNPNFFPQLLVRTGFMMALAGLLGVALAALMRGQVQEALRSHLIRVTSLWGVGGILFGLLAFQWYLASLPQRSHVVLSLANVVPPWMYKVLVAIVVLSLLHFLLTALKPRLARWYLALPLYVAVFFLGVYPGEKVRETIRKPYVVGEFMWSNQIIARDVPAKGIRAETELINEKGFLKVNAFVPEGLKEVRDHNLIMAGKAVAILQCSSCHNVTGSSGLRPFGKIFAPMPQAETVYAFLKGYLGQNPPPYMPRFVGTDEELRALSAYIAHLVAQGGKVSARIEVPALPSEEARR